MIEFYVDEHMLEERKLLRSKLNEMDAKIADTFQHEYRKMCEAGDDAGIMFLAGQLPDDFRHKVKFFQACLEIQDERKKAKA